MKCLFELPLPEISSHVGARRKDFVATLESLRNLLSTLCCIETIYMHAAEEIAKDIDISDITCIFALLCSCLANLSYALNLVKSSRLCKGVQAPWKPKAPEFWQEIKTSVDSIASIASVDAMKQPVSLSSRGRDSMLLIMNLYSLIQDVQHCEDSISKALDVPITPKYKTADKGKFGLKEKILENAYLPSILVHCALLSGGAVYALVIASSVKLFKGTKAFLKSKEDRSRSTYLSLYLYCMHMDNSLTQCSLQY